MNRKSATGPSHLHAWVRRAGAGLERLRPIGADPTVICFLLVAASLPSLFRTLTMVENDYAWRLVDLRGVATDFGIGFAIGLLLLVLRRANVVLFGVACMLWLAANVGYYEFLSVFGAPFALAQASYLGDPTFLEGSGFDLAHPLLVAILAATLLSGAAIPRPALAKVRRRAAIACAFSIALLPHLIPASLQVSEWRQSDLVSLNLADVASRIAGGDFAHAGSGVAMMPDGVQADLTGRSWLGASGRPNVLLVFIEGISGGHIPAVAATAGIRSTLNMPRLSEMSKSGLLFTRLVSQQNQSNRGLYAALCGDLPELARVIPKMSRIASGRPRPCLPAMLGEAGYNSVFIKSADSDFMQMREFGLKIGFDRVYGEEAAALELFRGPWGLSDDGLYSVALEEIGAMENEGQPWFMTLFTSSTHHPFTLPPGATADGETDRARAWDYADRSIMAFIDELRRRGILERTLVVLTSDEAGFVNDPGGRAEPRLHSLPENWGYAIVYAPGAAPGTVDDYFAQSDLALSIIDYLRLGDGDGRLTGRSMFRRYDTPRTIAFGAVYHRRVYLYDTGLGELTVCDEKLSGCGLYADESGDLFNPRMRFVREFPSVPEKVRAYQTYSLDLPGQPAGQNLPITGSDHLDGATALSLGR